MATTEIDNSDRTFLNYLKEISQSYVVLPKQLRLRVEKWVEKLTQTGANPTWKKHRNSYAKLLLNTIMTKQLTDPFHVNPPDGPLPTFPSHLRCHLKDMMGAHESSFWRDLFQSVSNQHDMIQTPQAKGTSNHNPFIPTHTREIQDLTSLVKEQSRKIELLEQQIHDERLQHELQVQKSAFNYRLELERLRKQRQGLEEVIHHEIHTAAMHPASAMISESVLGGISANEVSFGRTYKSQPDPYPTRSSFDDSILHHKSRDYDTGNRSSNQDVLQRNSIDENYHPIITNTSVNMHSGEGSLNMNGSNSTKRVPPPIPAFNYLRNHLASSTSMELEREVEDEVHENNSYRQGNEVRLDTSSRSSHQHPPTSSSSTAADIGAGRKASIPSNNHPSTGSNHAVHADSTMKKKTNEEDEFLKHIENFQKEVRSLQASSPLSK